jgi:CDGSH-type Zn-finger protein
LSYTVDGVEHRDGTGEPLVGYVPNGPYVIRGGGAALAGAEFGEGASPRRFALCRCGKSQNKPFCSGAHWDHQFDEHAAKSE